MENPGHFSVEINTPMVRALLEGRKTQTRRVLKPWPGMQAGWLTMETLHSAPTGYLCEVDGRLGVQMQHPLAGTTQAYGDVDPMSPLSWVRLPYAPGYRLWVREAHALVPASAYRMSEGVAQTVNPNDKDSACIYREGWERSTGGLRWRPSIHMPRWASRLTLTVTDVRVERLWDITNEDCIAEGVSVHPNENAPRTGPTTDDFARKHGLISYYGARYREIWNAINGPGAWDANPWVAAITFSVVRGNIDQIGGA